MTTMIYSGIALGTGYLFLYDRDGIITTKLIEIFPNMNKSWFTGFNAVAFTMTFACTSNHALFLRNAIRGIGNLNQNPNLILIRSRKASLR